ncbi:hypothetical protein ABZV60_25420 [Streptomyces sp. NPDC004787]|uniref:hypothetical protein n=1 Tax=Streptomyces sp. NPDC004787 TaxID=3154291 RepID=UPI0033BEE70E
MGVIQDRAVARLADKAELAHVLTPRARLLVEQTHELEHERIDSVTELRVRSITPQAPLFPLNSRRGNWSQVVPSLTRSDFIWEGEAVKPVWADVLAELEVDLVAETDPGGLDSLVVKAVDAYTTLDEFRSQFRFLDLDAFMRSHGLTTVEDLRESGDYLRTEVKLRPPPAFDPADPRNRRTVTLETAVVVGDPADVAGALRAARLVAAAARDRPLAPGPFGARTAPYALAAAFPVPANPNPPPQQGLSQAEIETLLTRAGIVAVFLN